ncbi:mitochondrial cytochrome c oxidase-like protein subunit V [Microthyrium microscopicum]|uniref:Cytochrome c oxidase polypeptide V n=1 Tax=Microthyrium microscopicum TaxID=703497 RepID=A0A6A6UKM8_9PEZI|nr:mitochondrial cytochrome c oxidase-like protein subunit V [Microthyrium microscopicum]
MLRTGLLRAGGSARLAPVARLPIVHARLASTAISNPTLSNIEARWEDMPPQEQADMWMALRDRMKTNWHELTPQEKKAAYYIAFGPHGPRAEAPAGEGKRVLFGIGAVLAVSGVIFGTIRHFAGPAPKTMTQEWQEASNEYMKSENIEPITGISSAGYKGPGMVQSKPSGIPLEEMEDDE